MLVNLQEISNILGVKPRTIQRLVQDGVLEATPDPGDRRKKVFDVAACVQAYMKYQFDKSAASKRSARMEQLEEKKLKAETELKESQGELHRLKTDIAMGKYLSKEDVKLDYERFFVTFKRFALAIPPRVTGMIASYVEPVVARGIQKDLDQEVKRMLTNFVVAGISEEDIE